MKRVLLTVGLCLLAALATYAATCKANAYKATKLSSTTVVISCNDEREPHVGKLAETSTAIIVTCVEK